ncbi:hypothetical protein GIB67_028016 [Kingdonia uniflora]|uniref:SHSP domain-containing protein n=1 Tax=Kingdonia uniflora TaxID=39325 RepID=A0A7J7P8C7_9MAGN|nr:hypothetical protein GIB67_028016 [Kingdonia uniflora]
MIIDPSTEDPTSQSPNASTRTYVRDAKAMASTPADVKEYPNSYIFIIDMPGLKSRDIKVTVEDENVLVISGREEERRGERRGEISAVCEDGVLSVSVEKLPPPEPKKPKTIETSETFRYTLILHINKESYLPKIGELEIEPDDFTFDLKRILCEATGKRQHESNLIVCNPVTGTCRQLPPLHPSAQAQTLHAISMSTSSKSSSSYTLILVFGDFPNFTTKVFQSGKDCWDEETMLSKTTDDSTESDIVVDETLYFLSKAGDVVTTNMQRSPSKQYSSVTTVDNREDIVLLAL